MHVIAYHVIVVPTLILLFKSARMLLTIPRKQLLCQIIKQHKTVRGNLACTMPPKTNVLLPIPDDRALRLSALPACIEKWIYKLEGGV